MLDSTKKMENEHAPGGEPEASMREGGASGRMTGQEREAITNAIERLVALEIDPIARVYVDDGDRLPSYAKHVGTVWGGEELDDSELDYAIGWLPSEAFLNDESPWPGSYNPYLTLNHLRTLEDAKVSNGVLTINGVVVEATEFAYDGCHKIYLIVWDSDRDTMLECGYTDADIHPIETLTDVWADTCRLRFISSADLSTHYVEQCTTAQVVWQAG